uniref:recombinase RecT n=1 Tax=Pseudonocardia sp. CA-138482 TaxID=3240023 RepID=UPI003F49888F
MGENLRGRVVARREQTTGDEGGKYAAERSLAAQIEAKAETFQAAMPTGTEARHLIRDAISLVRANPQLARCSSESVLGGLMTFAQLGLRPGVLGHGWLIPFKKRVQVEGKWVDAWEAQIVIGYKGYAELIHRTGTISTMVGRSVHAHDEFDLVYGIDDRLVHKPAMSGPRGETVGYYAVIKYQGGGYVFWHMTKAECEEWRDKFAMARKKNFKTGEIEIVGPWRDHFDSMSIKTCFLRAQNWAPKSTDLARAVAVDGAVRKDMDDADEMFFAERPDPFNGQVLDGEVEDAGPDEPAPLPTVEDDPEGWHAAGHPRVVDGEVQRADRTEWCELCVDPTAPAGAKGAAK